jgi:prolyl 4-hydroxylase
MEKIWFPQQSLSDAPSALLKNFIYYSEIPVSKLTIEKETRQHPEYPMLSFGDFIEILKKWGIEAVAYDLELEKLSEIPSPSILFLHDKSGDIKVGEFVMFYQISENTIEYLHPRKGWVCETEQDFEKKWAKAALSLVSMESDGEADFEKKEKEYFETRNKNGDLKILRIKDNFLTNEECDYIIALSESKFERSKIMSHEIIEDHGRTSFSAILKFPEDAVLSSIRKRAAQLIEMPESHFESIQCVSYDKNQEYINHYDTFDETTERGKKTVKEGGQRKYTMLAYLNDDFEGGGTHFPLLDVLVQPKKRRVVIFDNLDENQQVLKAAMHAGLPVSKGRKYAINMWVRNKPVNND